MLDDTKAKIKKYEKEDYYKFFEQNSGVIEAKVVNDLQRLYFPIQPVCKYLSKSTRIKFLENVPRENN